LIIILLIQINFIISISCYFIKIIIINYNHNNNDYSTIVQDLEMQFCIEDNKIKTRCLIRL